jgi:hypothetical protein
MVTFPPEITGEILVDGIWQRVPMRTTPPITITRGQSAEGGQAQPGKARVRINNRDGTYSPRNPRSPLYGRIGRNTPFQVRVGDLPTPPDPVVTDVFDRTETDGWGDADSGQTWTHFGGAAEDYSVSDGAARISVDVLDAFFQSVLDDATVGDFDATYALSVDTAPADVVSEEAILGSFFGRVTAARDGAYMVNVGLRVDTGVPGGGRRVAVNINRLDAGDITVLCRQRPVPGLVYALDVPLRVRVRMDGPDIRVRVWADGESEPAAWHAQVHDETYTSGDVGLYAMITAADTALPVTVSFTDLEVRPLVQDTGVVRLAGEVPAWPPRRSLGKDRWSPIAPAGVLRRLGKGQRPVKSVMRRQIPSLFPLGYWPLEPDARLGSGVPYGQRLTRADLDYDHMDATLPGSDALPAVGPGARIISAPVASEGLTSWNVSLMFRFAETDFPAAGEHRILRFTTAGSAALIWVVTAGIVSGGNRGLRLTLYDADSTELDTAVATHDGALAAGGPGLLDAWRVLRIVAEQVGADVAWRVDWLDLDASTWGSGGTLAGSSVGSPYQINTAIGAGVTRMHLGHLGVWGTRFTTGYSHAPTLPELGSNAPAAGMPGQPARDFLDRLAASEGMPLTITGPALERLGPYPPGTALGLARQVQQTEMGLLTEDRAGLRLVYRARETLYNQTPALIIDWSSGLVSDPVEPTDDDKPVVNRVIARRRGGSEVVRELTEGPLSVRPHPDGAGDYGAVADTIVAEDEQLPGQAGWRLHLGTADELRWTKLTLDLANERVRPLIDQILQVGEGDIIRITHPPDDLPPGPIDIMVLGYTETLGAYRWTITFNGAPASPWTVAQSAGQVREDFEDADLAVTITDAGDAAWARTETEAHTGTWSLGSGAITDDQTSDAVVTVPADAVDLSVWYKVSSEQGFDFLRILVDAEEVLAVSGEVGWARLTVPVDTASTVTCRYTKDSSVSEGDDAAWVDDLQFTLAGQTGDPPQRADTDGSVLAADVTATGTELLVHTPGGRWVASGGIAPTDSGDLPLQVRLTPDGGTGGETVTVTAVEDLAWDQFARAETDTWGDADSGHTWTETGGAASDRSVDGTSGVITLQADPDESRIQTLGETITDCEIRVRVSVDQTATGGSLTPCVVFRSDGPSDFYRLRMHFTPSGTTFLSVLRSTALIGAQVQLPWPYAPDDQFEIRARIDGHRIRARAWPTGTAEPAIWHIDRTVDSDTIDTGDIGLIGVALTTNTNVTPAQRFDNYQVRTPQRVTAQRAVNTISRGWDAGDDVRLAVPPIVPL